jgi:hypothetical protein
MNRECSESDQRTLECIEEQLIYSKRELFMEEMTRDHVPSLYDPRRLRETQRRVVELERCKRALMRLPYLCASWRKTREQLKGRAPARLP